MSHPTTQVIDEPSAAGAGEAAPGRRGARKVALSWGISTSIARGLLLNCMVAFLVLEAVQGILFTLRATDRFSFDILIIFPVLLRAFGQAIAYSLPVSLLFGTALLAGRLNADREILAMRSFGISPLQLLVPVALLGGIFGLISYVINTEMVPRMRFANRSADTLILDRMGYLGEGWDLSYNASGISLWIHHYDGPTLDGIFLTINRPGEVLSVPRDVLNQVKAPSYPIYIFAERGIASSGTGDLEGRLVMDLRGVRCFIDNDVFMLQAGRFQRDGKTKEGDPAAGPVSGGRPSIRMPSDFMQRIEFTRLVYPLSFAKKDPTVKDLPAAELRRETRERLEALRAAEMAGVPAAIDARRRDHRNAAIETHERICLSLASFLFPVCAFVIGLRSTSTNRLLPFFLATTIIPALYFSGNVLGTQLARRGLEPQVLVELGNIALVLMGGCLLASLHRRPR